MTLMARYELSTFQHLKGIEQRRSGAAQWLPGPRSIGQKEFPFRTIKSLLLLLSKYSNVGHISYKSYLES